MKITIKFLIVLLLAINVTATEAQSRKRVYDENEITLPNYLQYNTGEMKESAIKATMVNKMVSISWQTASEINTSHFELQRSENGKDFDPIETITAGGISKIIISYATTDERFSCCPNKLFYRLKTVFINGKEDFTDAIALDLNAVAATSANIIP